MQAIILAAGMGKRLGQLTKDNTKCMVEVGGVRLVERVCVSSIKRDYQGSLWWSGTSMKI